MVLQILDQDSALRFNLLRLQLVELIRTCTASPTADISPALDFATTHLGPAASQDQQFLEDLEKTMALLVFPHDSLEPPLAALLQPGLRREVADKVNKAILDRQYQRKDAAIHQLVRMRAWSELTARAELKKDLPQRIDLGLSGSDDEARHENGHGEAMITL
jgi:glucose-induced degradation protein 8